MYHWNFSQIIPCLKQHFFYSSELTDEALERHLSKTGVDLVIIQYFLINYVNDAVLMLISRSLQIKSREVSTKTRPTPASLSFKGQATKHRTVKWSIYKLNNRESENF